MRNTQQNYAFVTPESMEKALKKAGVINNFKSHADWEQLDSVLAAANPS